jgi:hypothetical protein
MLHIVLCSILEDISMRIVFAAFCTKDYNNNYSALLTQKRY